MKKFLEKFTYLEPLFRPFMGSSVENLPRTQNPVSSNASTAVVNPVESNVPSSRSVVSYRGTRPNFVDDNDHDSLMDLLSFSRPRSQGSSGAPQTVVPELARPLPLPLTPDNFPALPTSPGLLSYYSHGQHLADIERSILPEHAVIALACSTSTTPTTPSSSSAIVVAPSKELSLPDLCKYSKTSRFHQDSLDILNSQVFLPSSPVRPSFLSEEQFIQICVNATFIDLLKQGVPLADLIILQNLLRGWPGMNISNLQHLAANYAPLRTNIDFRTKVSLDLQQILGQENMDRLRSVVLHEQTSQIHEMVAMAYFNSQQSNQLVYTGHSRTPIVEPWCYNNSGNSCPDYLQVLKQAVGPYTHLGVDFKFKNTSQRNCDVIRGVSDDLETQTAILYKKVGKNITRLLNGEHLSDSDNHIGKQLLSDIAQNNADYLENKDLNNYVLSYNGLRDTYNDFFVRNKIGVNLIAPISANNYIVDEGLKDAFATRFKHNYLSENSSILRYLNDVARSRNGAMVDTKQIILDYAVNNF